MKIHLVIMILVSMPALFMSDSARASDSAERTIQLSTINWPPYTGKDLPEHGFFSELVTEAFSRVGYRVEFLYRPWARALMEAKEGDVHGVMDAYWREDRVKFLEYPDVVWKVKEEFIALRENPITYSGTLTDLKGYTIGALNGSTQAKELEAAGVKIEVVGDDILNVKKLLLGRFDAMILPRDIFFHHAKQLDPRFDRTRIKVLKPPYKVYDMYVAFSKLKPNYAQLTADFNRGLNLIKTDGTYKKILQKRQIMFEE